MSAPFRRGDVYGFDFGGTVGSEPGAGTDGEDDDLCEGNRRLGAVVQAEWLDMLDTVVVVPLTGRLRRRGQPTCVFLPREATGLPRHSVAVCHLVFALDKSRADDGPPVGRVGEEHLLAVEAVLVELFGIQMESIWSEEPPATWVLAALGDGRRATVWVLSPAPARARPRRSCCPSWTTRCT